MGHRRRRAADEGKTCVVCKKRPARSGLSPRSVLHTCETCGRRTHRWDGEDEIKFLERVSNLKIYLRTMAFVGTVDEDRERVKFTDHATLQKKGIAMFRDVKRNAAAIHVAARLRDRARQRERDTGRGERAYS